MSAARENSDQPFRSPAMMPMAEAIADGDQARIKALAPDTDLSARGADNVTLLEWAIWNKQAGSLATLLEVGADASMLGMDQETVAHMAAMADDPEYLKVLVDHDAPVDIVSPRTGRTPLFLAVQSRRTAQQDMLLKAGADVRRADSMGNTPLHVAANVNNADGVLELLEAGADPQAKNARGDTFQTALFSGADARLNAAGKAARQRVRDWLSAKGIAQD